MASSDYWEFHTHHFGAARLQHYLVHTGGDHASAMHLYAWNVAVSGAFWQSLGFFEVALRNALDGQMTTRQRAMSRQTHWIFDDTHELGRDANGSNRHRQPYKDVAEAIRRVRQNRKELSPEQIISELPFGFWHQLVSRHQMFLWPDLADAFPHAPSRAQTTIQQPVGRLRTLRNRIGHHHRVWSENLHDRYADLLNVAGYLDPALRHFIDQRSSVPSLLASRPRANPPR